jgi:hypothetical protein
MAMTRCRVRWLSGSLAIGVALTMAASALANTLELSGTGLYMEWTGLEMRPAEFLEPAVTCPVTLEGTFHAQTFAKSSEPLIGLITTASVDTEKCGSEGEIGFLTETLPWHIHLGGWSGALPRIVDIWIDIGGASISGRIGLLGGRCLYTSTEQQPLRVIATSNGGYLAPGRIDETAPIGPVVSGEFGCLEYAQMTGAGTFAEQSGEEGEPLILRLVE